MNMERILNVFKESLFDNINGAKGGVVGNDTCVPVIHPDATNGTIGTLLCAAMSTISLLVFYFCN